MRAFASFHLFIYLFYQYRERGEPGTRTRNPIQTRSRVVIAAADIHNKTQKTRRANGTSHSGRTGKRKIEESRIIYVRPEQRDMALRTQVRHKETIAN
jgi:hypothetical protein